MTPILVDWVVNEGGGLFHYPSHILRVGLTRKDLPFEEGYQGNILQFLGLQREDEHPKLAVTL